MHCNKKDKRQINPYATGIEDACTMNVVVYVAVCVVAHVCCMSIVCLQYVYCMSVFTLSVTR